MATRLGAQRQSGSGNQPGKRGDFRSWGWLGEVKNTEAAAYRVTRGVLDKITREADAVLLKPFVAIGFWSLGVLRAARTDWLYGYRVDDVQDIADIGRHRSYHTALGRHSGLLKRSYLATPDVWTLLYLTQSPILGWLFVPEGTALGIMEVAR
jgi:hypothetical protein